MLESILHKLLLVNIVALTLFLSGQAVADEPAETHPAVLRFEKLAADAGVKEMKDVSKAILSGEFVPDHITLMNVYTNLVPWNTMTRELVNETDPEHLKVLVEAGEMKSVDDPLPSDRNFYAVYAQARDNAWNKRFGSLRDVGVIKGMMVLAKRGDAIVVSKQDMDAIDIGLLYVRRVRDMRGYGDLGPYTATFKQASAGLSPQKTKELKSEAEDLLTRGSLPSMFEMITHSPSPLHFKSLYQHMHKAYRSLRRLPAAIKQDVDPQQAEAARKWLTAKQKLPSFSSSELFPKNHPIRLTVNIGGKDVDQTHLLWQMVSEQLIKSGYKIDQKSDRGVLLLDSSTDTVLKAGRSRFHCVHAVGNLMWVVDSIVFDGASVESRTIAVARYFWRDSRILPVRAGNPAPLIFPWQYYARGLMAVLDVKPGESAVTKTDGPAEKWSRKGGPLELNSPADRVHIMQAYERIQARPPKPTDYGKDLLANHLLFTPSVNAKCFAGIQLLPGARVNEIIQEGVIDGLSMSGTLIGNNGTHSWLHVYIDEWDVPVNQNVKDYPVVFFDFSFYSTHCLVSKPDGTQGWIRAYIGSESRTIGYDPSNTLNSVVEHATAIAKGLGD